MDPNALNLVIQPEADRLRGNIINHLKKQFVVDGAEGNAGHVPEESLGTGKRTEIRFKPIVLTRRKKRLSASSRKIMGRNEKGKKTISTNKGTPKAVGDTVYDSSKAEDEYETPLTQGIKKFMRGRSKKKRKPGLHYNKRKTKSNSKQGFQTGLYGKSDENFKNSKLKKGRKRLDLALL